ncbi:hypothetical protein [Floccifex sp.]|uniref:hypothetical protein n=1 Tax=Floccifex sp. TaxID=2815810 RepID=UPI003F01ABA5
MKRKIKWTRVFFLFFICITCISLIFFLFSFKKENKESISQKPTIYSLLETAIEPLGNTLYIYGGGWNEEDTKAGQEAVSIGLSKNWESFYQSQDESYDYTNYLYQIHDGLDCSGYIGWVVYNTLEQENNKEGYVYLAQNIGYEYEKRGLGYVISSEQVQPGDICFSQVGHVYLVLGMCEDGSILLIHSSPPGVKLSGTPDQNGNVNSQAVALAENIMKTKYSDWYQKFPDCSVDASYFDYEIFRFSIFNDEENISQMNASEVVETIF